MKQVKMPDILEGTKESMTLVHLLVDFKTTTDIPMQDVLKKVENINQYIRLINKKFKTDLPPLEFTAEVR